MNDLDNKWFPFLNRSQLDDLVKYFDDLPEDIMVHQLAVSLGVDLSTSITILSILHTRKIIELKLLYYHKCDPEMAIGAIPYGNGYPQLPHYCEECDNYITSYSEMDFDLMGKVLRSSGDNND